MVIQINDRTFIREIRETFSANYPFLKIDFFNHFPEEGQPFETKDLIPESKTIGEVRKTHISALLEIQPANTIADLEKEFFVRFGLIVRVLRKSNNHWIMPDKVDALSLKEQNETGRASQDKLIHPDYDTRIEDSEY